MKQCFFIRYYILLFTLLAPAKGSGQEPTISGKISDRATGEPIPYANIVFVNTTVGTTSNINGYYSLQANDTARVLQVSAVGYSKRFIMADTLGSPVLNIELSEEVIPIAEIEVTPGVNPAHRIMQEISIHKKDNDPAFFPDWRSSLYSKLEIDLKNLKKPDKTNKFWDQVGFVFDYMDTLETDGKTFLPVFITETVSDLYHVEDGDDYEYITANKTSGMQTNMVSEFTGKLYTNVNPYSNFINMADAALISPLHDQGLSYYRYFLRDSAWVDGEKIYELSFFPKQKQEPVFKGKFWISSSSYALKRIEMRLSENANINFVQDLVFEKEYRLKDGRYIPDNESIWADLNLQTNKKGKMAGLMGRKSTKYKDFQFPSKIVKIRKNQKEVSVSPNAFANGEQFWDSIRPFNLNDREMAIYEMVDSLKNVPVIKTAFDYIHMFFFGYKDIGLFEIGPYYYMYSYNEIEGNRFRFGGRTTQKFSPNLRLNGYLAYGVKDDSFKFSTGAEYYFQKDNLFSISTQYQHDYELLGRSGNTFMEDNILMTVLSKDPLSKLNMVNRFRFEIRKEWSVAWSNRLKLETSEIKSGPYVPFFDRQMNPVNAIRNTEIVFNTRLSPKERTVTGTFEKTSLGSPLPIMNINTSAGIKGFLSGNYNYLKLQADIYDKLPLHPVGYTTVFIQAGRIWGDLPFPLVKIHEGNETYSLDKYAFNLMNYQEFVSDRYVGVGAEHHFQGYFFNKTPLLRKLKWREVIGGKWLTGDIDLSGHNQLLFPQEMKPLNGKSYGEVSAGIENILKVIRVDGVWRLTGNKSGHDRFLMLVSIQFSL
ncbi:MAG: DUF5686 family protein [Mangrovibacterium sp.]